MESIIFHHQANVLSMYHIIAINTKREVIARGADCGRQWSICARQHATCADQVSDSKHYLSYKEWSKLCRLMWLAFRFENRTNYNPMWEESQSIKQRPKPKWEFLKVVCNTMSLSLWFSYLFWPFCFALFCNWTGNGIIMIKIRILNGQGRHIVSRRGRGKF